jgi:hypothetical protein
MRSAAMARKRYTAPGGTRGGPYADGMTTDPAKGLIGSLPGLPADEIDARYPQARWRPGMEDS